jgi:uncharacterized protein YecE (DUF72 family)
MRQNHGVSASPPVGTNWVIAAECYSSSWHRVTSATTPAWTTSSPECPLEWWAQRIREWGPAGKDVYAYFNNDGHGHAVRNAETLRSLLGQ